MGSGAIAPGSGPTSVQPGRVSREQGPADRQDGDQGRAGGDRVDGARWQTQVGERVVGRAEGGAGGEDESGRQRRGQRRARARCALPESAAATADGEHQSGAQRHRRRRQVAAEQRLRFEGQQLESGRVVALLGERLDQVERGDEEQQPGHDKEDDARRPGRDRDGAGGGGQDQDPDDPHRRPTQQSLPVATPDRMESPERSRSQGLRRGCSEASWRRSRTTVRRSLTEAEKRSSAASEARRRAASRRMPPTPSRPTPIRADARS